MQVGVDLIEISRIRKSLKNQRLLKRVFNEKELEYFKERNFSCEVIAGNFCVKEAFSKAVGTGIKGFSWKDVYALRNESGCPEILLEGKAEDIFKNRYQNITVSISHTKEYAIATVIVY